jgi:hypothetical protein
MEMDLCQFMEKIDELGGLWFTSGGGAPSEAGWDITLD